jgi:tetratricopeptide (TPR) repeat protein
MDASSARARPLADSTTRPAAAVARAAAWLDAHPRWAAVLVYGIALVARAVYLASFRDPGAIRAPLMDEAFYHGEAWNIVRGAPPASDAYFMTPLYPWFLSVVFRTVGDGAIAPFAAQMVLGALAAPLVWFVGRRMLQPLSAFAAAAAVATFAPIVFFEALYLVEWLILLALAVALSLAVAAPRRGVWAAATGACVGIAALGRGTNLALLPVVAAWFWFDPRRPSRRSASLHALAAAIGCAAVLAPLVVRNVRHAERPTLLTANLGFNAWVGNGPDANGIFVRLPGLDLQQDPLTMRYVQRRLRRPVTASETSAWWLARTRDWVRTHPARTLRLSAWKLLLFWNRQSIPQVEGFEAVAAASPLGRPPFWRSFGFLPLAFAGSLWILATWRRRAPSAAAATCDRTRRWIAVWVWVYAGAIALFFVTDRYRVAILPCLVLLAAVVVETLVAWWRDERRRRLPIAVAVLAAAFFATSPARIGIDGRGMHRDLELHAALRAAEAGRFDEALARVDRARAIDPADAGAQDIRARLLARAGRDRDAVAAFQELLAAHPDDARAWYNLGNAHRRAGRDNAALAAYQKSLALEPEREAAWNQLGEVYRTMGDTARAGDAYRSALALAPAYEQALNNLAALRAQQGQAAAAAAGFRAAVAANPRYVPALVNLALLLGDDSDEAQALWRVVLAVDPQNTIARERARRVTSPAPRGGGGR